MSTNNAGHESETSQDHPPSEARIVQLLHDCRSKCVTRQKVKTIILETVNSALINHENRLILHIDTHFNHLKTQLFEAFPNGDPIIHRIDHENRIKAAEAKKKITDQITEKIVVGAAFGIITWVAFVLWEAFKGLIKR